MGKQPLPGGRPKRGRGNLKGQGAKRADTSSQLEVSNSAVPEVQHTRSALVILGMHRSGTSALTGLLHRLGAQSPKTPLPAASDNPKGFAESSRLLDVHNRILASAGSSWADWTPFNPDWSYSAAAEPFSVELAQVFDDEFGDAAFIAVKDPRICRFGSFWFDMLEQKNIKPLPIVVFRNPLEVAASLEARGGMPLMHGMLLWLRHVLDAERASRGMARAFVDHRKVLDDWRAVAQQLSEQLSLRWPRYSPAVEVELDAWVDRSLRHQVSSEAAVSDSGRVAEWVKTTYRTLIEITEKGETVGALKALDQVRAEFDRASKALGAFCYQYESKANWSSGERQKAVAAKQIAETAAKALEVRASEFEAAAVQSADRLARAEQDSKKITQGLAEARMAADAKVKALEARIVELQDGSSQASIRADAASKEVDRLREALVATEREAEIKIAHRDQQISDLQEAARQSELRIAEAGRDASNLKQGLEASRRDAESKLKVLEARISKLQGASEEAHERATRAECEAADQIQQLTSAMSAAEAMSKSLEGRVVELQAAAAEQADSLAKSRENEARLTQALAMANSASDAAVKLMETQIADLQAVSARAREHLAQSEANVTKLGQELAAAKTESDAKIRILEMKISDLQSAATKASEHLKKSESNSANLERELAAAETGAAAKVKSLEMRMAELSKTVADSVVHRERFEALSRVQIASEERIARLTAEINVLRNGGRSASAIAAVAVSSSSGEAEKVAQAHVGAVAAADKGKSPIVPAVAAIAVTKSQQTSKSLLPPPKSNGSADPGQRVLNGKHAPATVTPIAQATLANPAVQDKLAHIETVRPFFDREFYLRRYADIARALERGTIKNGDPLTHYLEFGGKEKRDPNPWFSSDFYLSTHADVAKSGMNPLVHYVTTGRAEGRPYSMFAPGAPLFDAFSNVLGKSAGNTEKILREKRADLRQRLQSGELGRMVARASELEPLVRHSTLAAIRAGITPFRNEGLTAQIVAMHRMQEAAGWKRAKAVVLIPWVHLSGATRIAGHLCHALANIYGADEVVVIRTETSEFQFPEWFPDGCRHIDFAGEAERVRPDSRMRLLVEYLRSLRPAAIFNVNSRLLWEAMEPYGKALSDSAAVYAYLFCNDKNIHGDWVGYPVRNFHRFFDEFAGVITDSRFLATSLHDQFQLPPDQQSKLVTLDTPADTNVPVATRRQRPAGARPQVFWAGRFDRQKRVDIAYEIARRMPDVDFRMWGEAVLDKSSGRMKKPPNVQHEGVYQAFTDLPLQDCDAWLYTSEWDGVPNMLIEVAAAAIPLVGSLAGGTSDILAEGLSHPISDIENVDAYVGSIRTILAEPDIARERAARLREKIYRERNTSVYLDAVRKILPKESMK